ncbi:MAG: AIDA repeat-containing protein, partial [Lentisphaeria bacterium]|nr:AIDA repeat-containing protein [Lentisphaeria bacterium]
MELQMISDGGVQYVLQAAVDPEEISAVDGEPVAISNFTITGTEVGFVAGIGGLSWSDFKVGYGGYYYQNAAVVDAEKCNSISSDDMMCWAATAANMLCYTGWRIAGATDEDGFFSVFVDHFQYGDRYGGNTYYGVGWFLAGTWVSAGEDGWDYPLAGAGDYYSTTFDRNNLRDYLSNTGITVSGFAEAQEKLAAGYGVGMSYGYYDQSGNRTGGHAITLWGLTCDTSLSVTDPNYYTGIIITDSDDDKYSYSDPLAAPDVLKVISITYDSTAGKYILDPAYVGSQKGILEQFTFLAPNPGFSPDVDDSVKIYSGSVENNIVLNNGGAMYIYSGGTANSTVLNNGGSMTICRGGSARDTTVNLGGRMTISSGGAAHDTVVVFGGRMTIASGGTAAGKLEIASWAIVSAYAGAIIDFTVAEQTVGGAALVNNWSRITDAGANYTITVKADQAFGTYALAGGAANFNKTITVKTADAELGTITVGETLTVGNTGY